MHAATLSWKNKSWDIKTFLWFYPKNYSAPGGLILTFARLVLKFKNLWILLLSFSCLLAFDYKISGRVGSFSRVGFNNSAINSNKGIYPTGSYVTTVGMLQIDVNLLPKSVSAHKLKAGIGGELGALAFDSTKTLINQSDPSAGYQPAGWYYIGRWQGYLLNAPWAKSNYGNSLYAHNYIIYNSYISYAYKDIAGCTLGRYRSHALFLSDHNQGFECFVKKKSWRLDWFSSYGRGRSTLQYIRDFYTFTLHAQFLEVYLGLWIYMLLIITFQAMWVHSHALVLITPPSTQIKGFIQLVAM
ncbi:hypothetical protein HSHS1_01610 [Helicobacter suis HS1]|nr:hypothetical protein HSHS1_01610 [Helicobacter suis HS1]